MKILPNWLLCVVTTLGWHIDAVRNTGVAEVERRWPTVFLGLWRGHVVARTK